jgi:hypothetical protein
MYVSPRPLRLPETVPARRRFGLLVRPVLAYAVIAILAVTGARLLADHGVSAPLPCGETLAACAGP